MPSQQTSPLSRSVLITACDKVPRADFSFCNSGRFAFTPASTMRAVPLSSALLKQNPALQVAIHRYESSSYKLASGYVLPRASAPASSWISASAKGKQIATEEDDYAWGDDEFDSDVDDDDFGFSDDESDAGDEWETRDGILVLPSSSPIDMRPHPRTFGSFSSTSTSEEEDYPSTPDLASPPAFSRPASTLMTSSSSLSTLSDLDLDAPPSPRSDLSLHRTSRLHHYEAACGAETIQAKEDQADEALKRALAFASGFGKKSPAAPFPLVRRSTSSAAAQSEVHGREEGDERWKWETLGVSEEVSRLVALAQA